MKSLSEKLNKINRPKGAQGTGMTKKAEQAQTGGKARITEGKQQEGKEETRSRKGRES